MLSSRIVLGLVVLASAATAALIGGSPWGP